MEEERRPLRRQSDDHHFGFYRLPRKHHKHLKSTNMLERINEELARRTHIIRIFPNEESVGPARSLDAGCSWAKIVDPSRRSLRITLGEPRLRGNSFSTRKVPWRQCFLAESSSL